MTADRWELALAMRTLTLLRRKPAHPNTIKAARRRLAAVAIDADTRYGDAPPEAWAADWLVAVSSGLPEFETIAKIAADFRETCPPTDEAVAAADARIEAEAFA